MKTALALCALLGAGGTAAAQEVFVLPTKMELVSQSGMQKGRPGDTEWSSEVYLRYSLIGGDDGAGGKWSDDFSDGIGFRGEADFQYYLNQNWSIGGYLSIGVDFFGGKTTSGTTLDDWIVTPFAVGFKAKTYFGQGFFAEGYLGFGFVAYGPVDFTTSSGFSAPLFDSTLAFAFEIGGRIGYKFSQKFGVVFGFGYENWGPPDVNQTTLPGESAKTVENITIDLGIWFRY